ncbi:MULTISPECIES: hypothetical protein [Streptomyces]|uniref:hypothetical protein n=1 Tax=Streptomyces TaxID=1883 RepID=UPI00163C275D|nr:MULTISPECIES: hypothetical protein [Streptomyces]MBC2877854.1 hypothetical protein [Streptomyces sp. TYQ1024]UBI37991.1 hypothetical protein K7I03_16950 [Streptomyces mobaraensis]UKW30578.1 hypothetical protein MCU78_16905 [Streptomyces sp. TYQ1024]
MSSALSAIPALLLITLCYAVLCAVSPLGTCRKCHGFGFQVRKNRRGRISRGRDCRRCRGHGKRVRVGRHLYNLASRVHRDGTR